MYYYSRSYHGHPEGNRRSSYHGQRNDQMSNSARDLRDRPRRDSEAVYRRGRDGVQDPYGTARQGSRRHATARDMYAVSGRDRRSSRRDANVDDLAYSFGGLAVGNGRSRTGRDRNTRWHDEHMPEAPAAPRNWPRNGEYYLDRALRPAKSSRDNYNDAYQYMHGERPRRHTTSSTRHDPREYGHLNLRFGVDNTRHHDPSDSFRDRIRRWF